MIPSVELKSQFTALDSEMRKAIDRVLERSWFVLGEEFEDFERAFAAYLGADHSTGVGSGTDAIQLALAAAGIGEGDEVITVANTAVPTLAGVCATGATPVLADIDPESFTIDPVALAEAVTPNTKAVVPVHLYVIRSPTPDALRAHLKSQGVGTQLHYPIPIHLQEAYAFLNKPLGSFPESERAASEVLSLPMYPELTSTAIDRVAESIQDFFS